MKNYKRLGDYIREVNVRNRELEVADLLGVSISKEFIPSIANTIGTDMSTYKIVIRGQFAYGPVTSRNGDKVSIALLNGFDEAIISQAYTVFEIIDHEQLLPEYLMMWFRRPEFDRYARFHSHGSAREVFDWEELCDVMLPIPSITRQREIVAEYETLTRRIRINEQMIQNLESTAQTLYRKMFVDGIDKKKNEHLSNICYFQEGYVNPSQDVPDFFDGDVKWIRAVDVNGTYIFNTTRLLTRKGYESAGKSACLFEPDTIVITKSGTIGRLGIVADYMCGNRAVINIRPKKKEWLPLVFLFLLSKQKEFDNMAVGSAQKNLYVPVLSAMQIEIPQQYDYEKFNLLFSSIKSKQKENMKLTELQSLLLAKMGQ